MNDRLTILRHYLTTRFRPNFSQRQALEQWQDRQVQKLLATILPHSPFYRERFGSIRPENWRQAPVIDKAVMMENFDRLNTVGITRENAFAVAMKAEEIRDFRPTIGSLTVGLSSGTSGNRGLFLISQEERLSWAGTILAKMLPQPLWHKQRIAFFLRANSNLYQTVQGGPLQFQFFDLLHPIQSHITPLKEYQPTILIAPPSMLLILARLKESGALPIAPQRIVSVAEVLDPLDQTYLTAVFGQTIHQIYQCTEGFLGSTCSHGVLHLNEDIVVVEKEYIPGENRKFIPIITDFRRTTQPIIRYRLNDILTEKATPCPCGSPFTALEFIEGRCDDLFYLKSSKGQWVPVFPDYIRRAVITADAAIQEYTVSQTQGDRLEIWLDLAAVDRKVTQARVQASLQTLLTGLGCHLPRLHFIDKPELPPGRKLRRIERRFPFDPAMERGIPQ